jgi:response regulator RpfG family c-di-GMP phosphodiesterase
MAMLESAVIQEIEEYISVPIVHLLKHPKVFIKINIYTLSSGKYVLLNFAEEPFHEVLTKILKSGESQVRFKQNDFEDLILKFQGMMLRSDVPEFDEVVTRELQISENENAILVAQIFIKNYGLTPEIASMLETSNQNIQKLISKSKSILALLESYRRNCSEEFFKIAFTNYICSLILNQFPWRTTQILDKLMLASTICDLSLTIGDIEELKSYDGDVSKLSERVKNHPLTVIELLKGDQVPISLETITIIKQHHERPDGKGFPFGLEHGRINQLSAIFIVARQYADKVCEYDFSAINYAEVAQNIQEDYRGGFFTKTCQALVSEVSKVR